MHASQSVCRLAEMLLAKFTTYNQCAQGNVNLPMKDEFVKTYAHDKRKKQLSAIHPKTRKFDKTNQIQKPV